MQNVFHDIHHGFPPQLFLVSLCKCRQENGDIADLTYYHTEKGHMTHREDHRYCLGTHVPVDLFFTSRWWS
jgi:hypothetical protein